LPSHHSAGDVQLVPDVDDPAGHPGRVDRRVVFGPGADMAGQRDDVVFGFRLDIAAVGHQRQAVQGLLDVQVDVRRIGIVADIDVVPHVPCVVDLTDPPGTGGQ
jgi:hypothetical protein